MSQESKRLPIYCARGCLLVDSQKGNNFECQGGYEVKLSPNQAPTFVLLAPGLTVEHFWELPTSRCSPIPTNCPVNSAERAQYGNLPITSDTQLPDSTKVHPTHLAGSKRNSKLF